MIGYNSLKKHYFFDTIVSNISMRLCLFALAVPLASWGASTPEPASVVRTDSRTGRLVRRVVAPSNLAPKQPPAAIRQMIDETARQHEVDPLLVHSVIQVESNYNS